MPAFKNLIGQKFGKLTVLQCAGKNKWRKFVWKCLCMCGKETLVRGSDLKRTQSCGCLVKKGNHTTHRMKKTRFYNTWVSMKHRCLNSKSTSYENYGARGIKVCERWLKFENFRDNMYASYLEHCEKFGEKNTTIERKNVDGNYEPENCVWATWKEQNLNKRKTS